MKMVLAALISIFLSACGKDASKPETGSLLQEDLIKARALYQKENQPEKALEIFLKLTPHAPAEEAHLWIEQANVALMAGDTGEARRSLLKAESFPLKPGEWNDAAMAYQGLKDFKRTVQILDKLIQENPKNAEYWKNRGIAHHLAGSPKAAASDLQEALRLQPGILPKEILSLLKG